MADTMPPLPQGAKLLEEAPPLPPGASRAGTDVPAYNEPTFGEKAKALGYGAVTGFLGGPGELEHLGAYTIPEMVGAREKGKREKFLGQETLFPKIENAQALLGKIGIQKPREEVGGWRTAGEVLGGFGTALPSLFRGGVRTVLGTTTKEAERIAREAEKLGFKLSPAQTRQIDPLAQKGATRFGEQNQKLANELATKGTGAQSSEVTAEFISNRLKDLGSEYNQLYRGRQFAVDPNVSQALQAILMKEQELGVAGVSAVKQAAQTMLDTIQARGPVILGDDLQRLRNALTERARSTASRGNAHEIYDIVNVIDQAVAARNPAFKATLDRLAPQYRNTIILEDLYRKGGIQQGNISLQQLGDMLRTSKSAVRRSPQDIDSLGEIGRELRLAAQWEKGEAGSLDALSKALKTTKGVVGTGTGARSATARALQRTYTKPPSEAVKAAERAGAVVGAGAVAGGARRAVSPEEE